MPDRPPARHRAAEPPDPTSRYAGLPTVAVPAPGGGTRTMVVPRVAPDTDLTRPDAPSRAHQVRAGDRLDLLARAVLGDTTGWWRIADVNPFADATRLEEPGRTIRLPGV